MNNLTAIFAFLRKHKQALTVLLIGAALAGWCFLAVSSLSIKTATGDEGVYLASAGHLLTHRSWDLPTSRIHAPLATYWQGLWLLIFPQQSLHSQLTVARIAGLFWFFLFLFGIRRLAGYFFRGKEPHLCLVLSLLSVTIMAHARLASTDVPFLALITLLLYRLCLWWDVRHAWNAVAVGVLLGLCILTKFTATLLVPYVLLVLAIRATRSKRPFTHLIDGILICGIAWFFLNAGYFFSGFGEAGRETFWLSDAFSEMGRWRAGRLLLQCFPMPYLYGLDFQKYLSEFGSPSYFHGAFTMDGIPFYYFLVLLIKTPPSFLILVITGLVIVPGRKKGFFRHPVMWLLPVIYLAYFSLSCKTQLGIRHMLPLWPFFLIAAAAATSHLWNSGKITVRIGLVCIYLAQLVEFVNIHPDYIAYFSPFFGGPKKGYLWLADSNIDWNQDAGRVVRFVEAARETVYVNPVTPVTGKVIVSVSKYQNYINPEKQFLWLHGFEPSGYIGYSWLLFDLAPEDFIKRLERDPGNLDYRITLAELCVNMNRLPLAQRTLTAAEGTSVREPKFWVLLGRIFLARGFTGEAVTSFNEGLALRKADVSCLNGLTWTMAQIADSAELTALERKRLVARAFQRCWREPPGEIRAYEEWIGKGERIPWAWNNLGVLYYGDGRLDESEKAFRKALEADPFFTDSLANLLVLYEERNAVEAWEDTFQRYAELAGTTREHIQPRLYHGAGTVIGSSLVLRWIPPPATDYYRAWYEMYRDIRSAGDADSLLQYAELAVFFDVAPTSLAVLERAASGSGAGHEMMQAEQLLSLRSRLPLFR
ncbi:MAG: tetratricopeptide repeat protein [Candidatus Omnitrophica bacterium]|nr:tetratricopeptide repeat protein [Candidatus Omnitrophota bacterium]